MARPDGRPAAALRLISLERGANPHAEGSCLVRFGETVVLCTASVLETVPAWRGGEGIGWVTAILQKYNKAMRYVEIAMGVLLVLVGIMLFSGVFEIIAQRTQFFWVDFGL